MAFRFSTGKWATFTVDKVPDEHQRLAGALSLLCDHLTRAQADMNDSATVVVETFDSMGRYLSKFGIETIELIGAVKAICYMYGVPLVRQAPMERVPFEKTAKQMLRERATELKLTVTDHDVSALSHLLRYEYEQSLPQRKQAQPLLGTV